MGANSANFCPSLHPVHRRIFGIETEYGVSCTFLGQRRLSPDEVSRYLFRRVVSWGRSSNVFLQNGSRLYLDVGSHPEYATPECDSLTQLLIHDRAGDRILEGLVEDGQARLAAEGIQGEIYLFKNNTDTGGNSYGCHENYLVERHGDFARLAERLIPMLITRQLLTGAGKVLQTPRGAIYAMSQRADHIWEGTSSATTRSRPIINTRDEPHADADLYRRLHVIVGDSNMSETTIMLKVGMVDLLLRMLEGGGVMKDMTMENPIRAIREISHDHTGGAKIRLTSGRTLTALEIQQEYFERISEYADQRGLRDDPIHAQVLELWQRGLTALATNNLTLIDEDIDWVIKKKLLERYMSKHNLDLASPRIAQLDLAYHDVSRKRGLFYLLESKGMATRLTSDLQVFQGKSVPPQTTRAKLRGDFVRAATGKHRDFTVDWVNLKLNDQTQRSVICKDPFTAVDERVERLIEQL